MGLAGLAGGGALVGLGFAARADATNYASAASAASTWPDYEAQASSTRGANAGFGLGIGTGAALVTAGVVAMVLSAVHIKRTRELRARRDYLLREFRELDRRSR